MKSIKVSKALRDLGTTKNQMQRWINALRSGEYTQTRYTLESSKGFCCLGVACDVFVPREKLLLNQFNYIDGELPACQDFSPLWLKGVSNHFKRIAGNTLTELNDQSDQFTFDEIADLLQAVYIEGVLDGVN